MPPQTCFLSLIAATTGRAAPHPRAFYECRMNPSTLGLYRQLLRASAIWPSRNRAKIQLEIQAGAPALYVHPIRHTHSHTTAARSNGDCTYGYTTDWHTTRPPPSSITRPRRSRAEFRQNRRETDATKLQKMLSDASTGLQTMHTQIGWKNSPEIGNTSGVLSGIKPAAGD